MIRINAGDSWWEDIDRVDGEPLPDDAVGAWAIVTVLGAQAAASGSMTLAEDATCMRLRIAPDDTDDISPGMYLLVKQISSASLAMSTELVEQIRISPAGIGG